MNEYKIIFETFSLENGIKRKEEKVRANNYQFAQSIIKEKYMVTKIIKVHKMENNKIIETWNIRN